MTKIYVRVFNASLPESCATSIYTCPINGTPEANIKRMNTLARKRGFDAVYSLATAEEYKAHYAAMRATTAAANAS
jgi:hypothetical protein